MRRVFCLFCFKNDLKAQMELLHFLVQMLVFSPKVVLHCPLFLKDSRYVLLLEEVRSSCSL